jgi:hypothetical protein
MTAPTNGFGEVYPLPFAAKRRAKLIKCSSSLFKELVTVSLAELLFKKFLQALKILDLSMHNAVTNMCGRMKFQQGCCHPIPQNLATELAPSTFLDSVFQSSNQSTKVPLGNRKFGT